MAYNDRYWVDKTQRAKIAKSHTKDMEKLYKDEIEQCVLKSRIYDNASAVLTESTNVPTIIVDDIDSVGAIFKYGGARTCVLNFSSYKNPGGMFLKGSKAQEECLCHESFLYNVLKEKQSFYDYNSAKLNRSLYTNRAIYSPDVLFMRDDKVKPCDVLTCASPNRTSFIRYNPGPSNEAWNNRELKDRINFIAKIISEKEIEVLILGAYGCGVFGQDAEVVASYFKEAFATTNVKTIVYAVPSGSDKKNYESFQKIFK